MDRSRGGQPIRVPTGGPRGQRKQLEGAQRVIPLPQAPSPAAAAAPQGGGRARPTQPQVEPPNIWGPTERPDESITAAPQMLPDDPAEFLRAVQMMYPSAALGRLLERAARRTRRGL